MENAIILEEIVFIETTVELNKSFNKIVKEIIEIKNKFNLKYKINIF
jgi:hypothetical protein